MINKIEKFILRKICSRLVTQGLHHKSNIAEYYKIMKNAVIDQFTEDNQPTIDDFLLECFNEPHRNKYGYDVSNFTLFDLPVEFDEETNSLKIIKKED